MLEVIRTVNTNRHSRVRQRLIALSVVLLACGLSCAAGAATPVAEDFASLKEACHALDPKEAGNLIPAESPILTFEENAHFLCATADLSESIPASFNTEDDKGPRRCIRRFIFLKPSIWVIESIANSEVSKGSLQWEVDQQDNGPRMQCELLWSSKESLQRKTGANSEVRRLQLIQFRPTDEDVTSAEAVLGNNDGRFDITITSADRVYRLQLPPPEVGAGRIAVEDAEGKTLVPLRPLPSGVLPHGEEGMKLLDRWDRFYRDGRHPPWNSGTAAPDLREAVEKGDIKPCRVIVLGCGSGMNSIYLAKRGFDVTAIDVAPTALSIAGADAKNAGVKVKWMLADVLALPEMEPFDLIFDRGCYHNVRYVDAKGFVESLDRLSRPGTKYFVLSCDRDRAPGVREPTMREDLSELFDFEWIRKSHINTGKEGKSKHVSWNVMLRKKGEEKHESTAKPNIIFVLADDLGWAELGCYGNRFNETPNLDRLAAQGMRFTDAYAAAPVCSPFRASFISGQWPARVGITDYLRPNDAKHLSTDHVTIAEMLRAGGYATGMMGKWHLTGYKNHGAVEVRPTEHGFDEALVSENRGIGGGSYFHPYHFNREIKARLPKEFLVDRMNLEAVEFIRRHKDHPFFLFKSHYAVHTRMVGRPDLVAKYEAKPDAGKGNRAPRNNPHLAAQLESIDTGVGMIMKTLDELGLTERTLLIFTSDNGGEGGVTSNAPLRGAKSQLYEGGIREPLIVRYGGLVPAGSVCKTPVCSVDYYPTFLDLAGIRPSAKQKLDGVSILPLLNDPGAELGRATLYWHYPLARPHFLGGRSGGAIRHGDWKLKESFNGGKLELYNLADDLGEENDLSRSMPEKVTELHAKLKAWRESVGAEIIP